MKQKDNLFTIFRFERRKKGIQKIRRSFFFLCLMKCVIIFHSFILLFKGMTEYFSETQKNKKIKAYSANFFPVLSFIKVIPEIFSWYNHRIKFIRFFGRAIELEYTITELYFFFSHLNHKCQFDTTISRRRCLE